MLSGLRRRVEALEAKRGGRFHVIRVGKGEEPDDKVKAYKQEHGPFPDNSYFFVIVRGD